MFWLSPDSQENEVELTAKGDKCTFSMPSRAVTVIAAFAPLPEDAEQPCDDRLWTMFCAMA